MQRTLKLMAIAMLSTLFSCGENNKTIVVGASSTPHALILEQTQDYIESKGYKLEIRVFDDYVLPNYALENSELDANYFQHKPYLNDFNESNGTHLVPVLDVHFEPMGIYKGTKSSIADFRPGDKIVVPSDKSNNERAMDLLNKAFDMLGWDDLDKANIIEVEAQTIPLMLDDCAFAVINGNYALSSGVLDKCIVREDKTSEIAQKMANVIAVKVGHENSDKTKLLIEAICQENVRKYIKDTFGDSVIPMF